MPKLASYPDTLRLAALAVIAAAAVAAPSAALAARVGHTIFDSTAVYWKCLAAGRTRCLKAYEAEDPPSIGVTSLTLSMEYDPSVFTFDPADSGPLGIYSAGGDAPPVAPGIGTQPFQELPSTGFTPGAPLPGSTLTYTDVGGLLTVDYELASPITASDDVNYFLLAFDLVHPVPINFALSTVTYLETGPGADFTKTAFSCTTTTGDGCGSAVPTSGVTINFVGVPEPAAWALLIVGFTGLGAILRARRSRALAV